MSITKAPPEIDLKEVEKHLKECGCYEKGMDQNEMLQLYKTLKQSEDTANKEREYRKSLNISFQHEIELAGLLNTSETEVFETDEKNCIKKVETVEDNNNIPGEKFFPTHDSKDHAKKDSDFSSDSEDEIKPNSPVKTVENKPQSDVVTSYLKNNKNINVFIPEKDKDKKIKTTKYKDVDLPFHCRNDISKLPIYLAAQATMKYHDTLNIEYKKFKKMDTFRKITNKLIPIPVVTKNKNNRSNENKIDNLDAVEKYDEVKKVGVIEKEKEITEHVLTTPQKQSAAESEVRSSKRTKRKYYKELDSDEENFCKKKGKDPTNLAYQLQNWPSFETDERYDYESIQNKMFDDLRDSPLPNKLRAMARVAKDSSDDEPSQQIEVCALVHNEQTTNRTGRKEIGTNSNDIIKNNGHSEKSEIESDNIFDTIFEEKSQNKNNIRENSEKHDLDKIEIIDDGIISSSVEQERFVPRRIIPPNPYLSKSTDNRTKKNGKRNYKKNLNSSTISELPIQKIIEEKEVDKKIDENDAPLSSKILKTSNEGTEKISDLSPKLFYGSRTNRNRSRSNRLKSVSEECPLCSKSFPVEDIEAHAANCGLDMPKSKESKYCPRCERFAEKDHLCS